MFEILLFTVEKTLIIWSEIGILWWDFLEEKNISSEKNKPRSKSSFKMIILNHYLLHIYTHFYIKKFV